MKIKPIYVYSILIVAAIAVIIFFSQNSNSEIQQTNNSIPLDEIHQTLQNNEPSSSNVVPDIKQKIDNLDNYVKNNPKDTVKLKEYAELLGAAHNPDKAISLYNSILEINPSRIDILSELSLIYFQKNEFDKAEDYVSKILQLDKNNLEANYNLGVITFAKGDAAKAKEIWKDVINKFPNTEISNMAKKNLESL